MSSLTGSYGLGLIIEAKNKASKVFRQVQGDFNRFTASQQSNLVKMRSWSNQMGQNYSRMRMGMMKDLQIVAGGAALAAPLIMVGKAAADSEMRLANVKSLLVTEMGPAEVEKSMGKIRDAIFKTGHDSMIPLTQMEVAMYDLKSADLSVDEAIGALPATAKLAVAGLGTMDEAVKYQTAILNTYGKSWGDVMVPAEKAGKIANITANTIAGFKTTLPELSEAMQYAAGPANALRVEFAELTSTIGALQTAGLKGTLAGTALSAFYRSATRLVSQSGEEYNGAEISAERYFKLQEQGAKTVAKSSLANLDLIDSTGKLKPLPDILEIVEKRFNINAGQAKELAKQGISVVDGMAKMNISAKEAAVLQKDFGDQGSRALMMLMGQSDALREKIIVTAESNNLDKMVAARQDTLIGKLRMTKNRFQELAITIGGTVIGDIDTGGVNSTLEGITEFAKNHPATVEGLVKTGGALVGLIGGFAGIRIAGRLAQFAFGWLPGVTNLFKVLGTSIGGVGGVLTSLATKSIILYSVLGTIEGMYKATPDIIEDWKEDAENIKNRFAPKTGASYIAEHATARMEEEKVNKEFYDAMVVTHGEAIARRVAEAEFGPGLLPWERPVETPKKLSYLTESPFHQYGLPERIGPGKSIGAIMAEQESIRENAEKKEEVQTKIEKNVTLDVNLHGDNLKYDVDTMYQEIMEKMESEHLLSEEGEM